MFWKKRTSTIFWQNIERRGLKDYVSNNSVFIGERDHSNREVIRTGLHLFNYIYIYIIFIYIFLLYIKLNFIYYIKIYINIYLYLY